MIEQGRSGILVPNGDVAALGDAMAALCRDPDRRQALSNAAKARMTLFDMDHILASWRSVIFEVLKDHPIGAEQ